MTETAAELAGVRAAIDDLDRRIVQLIAERQRHVERAGVIKRDQSTGAVRDPARVERLVAAVRERAATAGASPEVVEATYRAMIGAFVDLEIEVHRG